MRCPGHLPGGLAQRDQDDPPLGIELDILQRRLHGGIRQGGRDGGSYDEVGVLSQVHNNLPLKEI